MLSYDQELKRIKTVRIDLFLCIYSNIKDGGDGSNYLNLLFFFSFTNMKMQLKKI